MRDVLVEHDAVKHLALRQIAARELLHLCVALDVDLLAPIRLHYADNLGGLDGQVGDHVSPSAGKLGVDGATHDVPKGLRVVEVNGERDLLHDGKRILQGLHVPGDDQRGVEVLLEQGLGDAEHLPGEDDHGGGAVAHLLVLRTAQLDHVLRRGVGDIHFAENGIAIVGHHNASHRVQEHLEHRARAERCPDDAGDRLPCLDVRQLRLATLVALRVLVDHVDPAAAAAASRHHGAGQSRHQMHWCQLFGRRPHPGRPDCP
mmetsp:Transcript_43358/g.94407  ORF Transcript_43358/g.94407 Transcript_43358/m.94407 type:complete len:260 (-) Transcript_43358:42-821(-)